MKNKFTRSAQLFPAGLTLAVLHLCVFAFSASAQVSKDYPRTYSCTQADQAEVTSFSITPSQPELGQNVTVKMTIKNKCPSGTNPLKIDWDIAKNDAVLAQGTNLEITAGASKDFTASWTCSAGSHYFAGGISNIIAGESVNGRNNNNKSLNLTVLDVKQLDYDTAANAGAQFANNRESGQCYRLGQFNGTNANNWGLFNGSGGVAFVADCTRAADTGGKANPEAFKNFTLKNGWTVKSVTTAETFSSGGAGLNVITQPSPGSTNPLTKVHVWADHDGRVYVRMVIMIQGPVGTNPYQ